MFGGRRIDRHAADRIDRQRHFSGFVSVAMMSAAAGMRAVPVIMGVIVMMAVAVRMIRLRQSESPGLLNTIP
jgi:NaMN:DMB phosphoribosyltransferase